MKRFLIITGIFLLLIVLLLLFNLAPVRRTSFYNEEYFHRTSAHLDSLRPDASLTTGPVRAGFSRVSITPRISQEEDYVSGSFGNIPLAGFGDRKGRPATGVHDSLFVRAVSIETGGRTIVFIGADLLIMPPNVTDSVMAILAEKGFTREQLFFSATHTHSGVGGWAPGFIGKEFAGEENKDIQKWLALKIAEAVTAACNDLKSAKIGAGSFNAGKFTRNRTTKEAGTRNNDFSFIVIEQDSGSRAVIGSFSAHSTTMGDDNMEFSADYPGFWSAELEDGHAVVAVFFAGSVGSQSPVSEGEGFERAEFMGESLADSTIVHLSTVQMTGEVDFSYVSVRLHLPPYHIRLTTKINLSTFLSSKLMPPPENVFVQAVRLGNMVWITAPGDFSGEYALQLKNTLLAEGFLSNISSFNGSYVGYIVPGRYFYVDGYESRLMSWFGPDMGEYTMEIMRQASRIVTGKDNI